MMITKQALEFALAKGMIRNPYTTVDKFWNVIPKTPSIWADTIAILEYIQHNEQFPDPKREDLRAIIHAWEDRAFAYENWALDPNLDKYGHLLV